MTESSTTEFSPTIDPSSIYVFISYAREDAAAAEQVERYLNDKAIKVFRDRTSILLGQGWDGVIHRALDETNVMVLLLTKASMPEHDKPERKEVANEWGFYEDLNKLIIPLYLEPCDIHYRLKRHHYLDARAGVSQVLDQLYEQLLRHFDPRDPSHIPARHVDRQNDPGRAAASEITWSWPDVQRALRATSRRQSARLRAKYDELIYLPRQRAAQHIDSFLTSTYPGLVLVGKSGVGKSNFVMAEIEGRFANDADKAVIVLDGGTLENTNVVDFIVQHVSKELGYTGAPLSSAALLEHFASNADFTTKQIIVVIDAINESEHAVDLTRSVDWWIEWLDSHDITWLKFIITTLPQSWRNIQAGTGRLNDNLYYRPTQTGLNTLDQDYVVELTAFDIESDLPRVYEKYRARTGITTTFNELSAEVRQLLCDPFALRIVMKTYGKRDYQFAIPRAISTHQIIEHYTSAIQFSSVEPFHLITKILLPLMFVKGDYKNMVTRADLVANAKTATFAPVFFEDALPANAPDELRQAQQELQQLVNAEILNVTRTGGSAAIRFTYERFYNYFAAKHLKEMLNEQDVAAQNQIYTEWFNSLAKYPYLWGPLYILLLEEGRHGNTAILQAILQTDDVRARDLLTNVLIELGSETSNSTAHEVVSTLCQSTLERAEPASSNTSPDGGLSTIVAQVAESLRMKSIIERGVLSTNSAVSDAMTGVLINLWVSSSPADVAAAIETTWQVVSKLSWLRPRQFGAGFRNIILTCLVVMMSKYRDTSQWPALSDELRRIVVATLRKLPAIRWLIPKTLGTGNTTGVRLTILQAVINFVIYVAVRVGDEGQMLFDLSSAQSFFKLSPAQRQAYRPFIDNITAERSTRTLEDTYPLLLKRADETQLLGGYILALPLMGQIPGQASAVNDLVARLFDQACQQLAPTLSRASLTGTFIISMYLVVMRNSMMTDTPPTMDDLRNFEDIVRRSEQLYWSTFKTTSSSLIWMDVASYYFLANRLGVEHDYELLREMIQRRIKRNDVETMPRFLHDLAFVGTHHMYQAPQLALDLLRVVLEELPAEIIKTLRTTLIDELVLLRTADEYRVEMFLQNAPDLWLDSEAKRQIRTRKPRHKIGERVGVAGSWFARDIMFDDKPLMRRYLQWFFYTAIDSTSVREWFSRIAGGILHEFFQGSSDPEALIAQTQHEQAATEKLTSNV